MGINNSDIKENINKYVSKAYIDNKPYIVEFDTRLQEGTNGKSERHFILEGIYEINNKVASVTDTPKGINRFVPEATSKSRYG